jgi:putative molybdopterin biosynthesis protein
LLENSRIPASEVNGYTREVGGHMTLCETIAAGFADAGIGVEAVARLYGLDFTPLDEERYDLVIPDHFLNDMPVQALIDLLGRSTVRRKLEALEGYDVTCMGLTPEL